MWQRNHHRLVKHFKCTWHTKQIYCQRKGSSEASRYVHSWQIQGLLTSFFSGLCVIWLKALIKACKWTFLVGCVFYCITDLRPIYSRCVTLVTNTSDKVSSCWFCVKKWWETREHCARHWHESKFMSFHVQTKFQLRHHFNSITN